MKCFLVSKKVRLFILPGRRTNKSSILYYFIPKKLTESMQWKLTVLMVLANAITKTRMDQQAIPKTEVYRPTKELWSETESLLDCDFKNGPCYWRQQVDYSDRCVFNIYACCTIYVRL